MFANGFLRILALSWITEKNSLTAFIFRAICVTWPFMLSQCLLNSTRCVPLFWPQFLFCSFFWAHRLQSSLLTCVLFSQCYRHIQMTALKNVNYFTTQCVEVMVELTRTNAIWSETTVLGQKRTLQRFTKENVWTMKKMKQKIESEWWLSCYCCCCCCRRRRWCRSVVVVAAAVIVAVLAVIKI